MTEANKFLDSLKDGYDEVKLHEMISVPKIRLQGIMQEYADKQFAIQLVTFCLPIEGDTFVSWHSRYFKLQIDGSVVAMKNETIKYTQDQMLELWNFLTDRLMAN